MTEAEKDALIARQAALIRELVEDVIALHWLARHASWGDARVRAFVDPQAPRKPRAPALLLTSEENVR